MVATYNQSLDEHLLTINSGNKSQELTHTECWEMGNAQPLGGNHPFKATLYFSLNSIQVFLQTESEFKKITKM